MTTIAIVNSNDELIDILSEVFRRDGYDVVTAHSREVREGKVDLTELMARCDPAVLLYDIAVPYDENWQFVRRLRQRPELEGRQLILTSTNKRALEELVGPTDAYEIVGKPFDVQQIREAVKRAASRVSPPRL
jgi:CheY-like chemotaxis protein